jgi:hypothetical protein
MMELRELRSMLASGATVLLPLPAANCTKLIESDSMTAMLKALDETGQEYHAERLKITSSDVLAKLFQQAGGEASEADAGEGDVLDLAAIESMLDHGAWAVNATRGDDGELDPAMAAHPPLDMYLVAVYMVPKIFVNRFSAVCHMSMSHVV